MENNARDSLISRQAAIDAIVQCTNCGDEDTLRAYVLKHNLDNGWTGGILEALDAVKDLPSAQPEQRWVPVTERLPEEGLSVPLTISGKTRNITFDHALVMGEWYESEGWYIEPYDFTLKNAWLTVYAWADLEPYGGKKELKQ